MERLNSYYSSLIGKFKAIIGCFIGMGKEIVFFIMWEWGRGVRVVGAALDVNWVMKQAIPLPLSGQIAPF